MYWDMMVQKIISDSFTVNIEEYQKSCDLLPLIKRVFSRPSRITDQGKISLENPPIEWGGPCPISGRSLCKGSILKHFTKDKHYEEIKYFGDGQNDLCPTLKLTSSDTVFPRKDYDLHNIITKGEHEIVAQVKPWSDGHEIMKSLKSYFFLSSCVTKIS